MKVTMMQIRDPGFFTLVTKSIVGKFYPLTLFAKNSIFDVRQDLNTSLNIPICFNDKAIDTGKHLSKGTHPT